MKFQEYLSEAYGGAYWLSPRNELIPVGDNHISMVISNPEKFGMKKDYVKALKEIETFQGICKDRENPYFSWAIYLTGEVYWEKDEKDKAKPFYQRMIEEFPGTQLATMAAEKLKEK